MQSLRSSCHLLKRSMTAKCHTPYAILFDQNKAVLRRSYKNFGHKQEPLPYFTAIWYWALAIGFVATCTDFDAIYARCFEKESNEDQNQEAEPKPSLSDRISVSVKELFASLKP